MRSVSASNDHDNIKLTFEALETSQVSSNSILRTKVPRYLTRGSVYMIYGLMNDVHEEQSWVCLAIQFFNATNCDRFCHCVSLYRPRIEMPPDMHHLWPRLVEILSPQKCHPKWSPYHPFHHYSPPRTEM
jgi:hypothetical protein